MAMDMKSRGKSFLILVVACVGCVLPSVAIDGLWGVNYYAPFALDYNELTRRGVDHKAAIRDDIAHFRRLGLDLLRVHCFDRQISRRDGSLADTVHLELLDYLVSVAASDGSGVYFLDRVRPGVWRLQIYPSVMTVADPFSGTAAKKTVLVPGDVAMNVHLPDLGESFAVRRLSDGENAGRAERGAVVLAPGDYVLMQNELAADKSVISKAREANVPPYIAPEITNGQAGPLVSAILPGQWRAGADVPVRIESVFTDEIWVDAKPADGEDARRCSLVGRFRHLLRRLAVGAETATWREARCPPPCMHEAGIWHFALLRSCVPKGVRGIVRACRVAGLVLR